MDFPMQNITIFHKEDGAYIRYVVNASFRQTETRNYAILGASDTDTVLIRVFDYNSVKIAKGDVIVNKEVDDTDEVSLITYLSKTYGNDNVYQVSSVDSHIYGTSLDHIKIGAK